MRNLSILFALLCGLQVVQAQPLAFPTAEGFGKHTTGGRGGAVYTVTNLNDSGEGSLRWAVEQAGSRTIVFAVDGTIDLKSKLVVKNDSLTIAGQSAPGAGICLKGYPFYVQANNVIVRYIRVRMGDINAVEDDAMGAMRVRDIIFDHCSASWSVDECMSVYRSDNVTVQWCLVSHSLAGSSHHKGAHGFGGIWGGSRATFHHNLLANHTSRNPRFASDSHSPVDYRNNVVYNWGFKSAYGGGQNGRVNYVANYYKPGPATEPAMREWLLDPAEDGTGSYHVTGNLVEGSPRVSADNRLGIGPGAKALPDVPFEFDPIAQQTPAEAYESVLAAVGCSKVRDSYDELVIAGVRSGRNPEGRGGIIDSQEEVGGWPQLASGVYPEDADGDGMADAWERERGLNPADAADGRAYGLSREYTNLEVYLNSLLGEA